MTPGGKDSSNFIHIAGALVPSFLLDLVGTFKVDSLSGRRMFSAQVFNLSAQGSGFHAKPG